MAQVQRFQASASVNDINQALEEDGCVIIEGLLDKGQIQKLQAEMCQNFNTIPVCQGNFFGFATKRMSGVIAKSEVSRDMAVQSTLLNVMDHFLLKSCRQYQLNLTQAIQIW